MRILITDGDSRAALAVTRSLGRKKHTVYVSASKSKSLASLSRFCCRGFAAPDPLRNHKEYVEAILALIKKEKIDIVFPITEQSIYLLNPFRNSMPSSSILACPPQDVIYAVSDKYALFKLAESLGIATPKTLYLKDAEDLYTVLDQINCYPVVVKPAFSRIDRGNGFLMGSIRYASNQNELKQLYLSLPALQYPSLIQEKITGPGTGLFTLYDRNRHLSLFSHKRLKEKPPSGGVSVLSESVPLDNEMIEASHQLLSTVGYSGIAMVEFKRDERDNKAKLMEINGRFWGSLQLAIACGVDFPCLYLDYLLGNPISHSTHNYLIGHKLKWFFGYMDHLIIRLKYRDVDINLPAGSPTKWQTFIAFMKLWEKNTSFDVFDKKDILPFLFEAYSYFRLS
jgi:predicted ATP-grasp superfamily ATP-dependent carboligase